jgi:hypothetical protein
MGAWAGIVPPYRDEGCIEASHLCVVQEPGRNERRLPAMKTHPRLWPVLVVVILVVAACGPGSGPDTSVAPGTGIAIMASAGPTCPVEQPGDPACDPRPVAGASIAIIDGQGNVVTTVVTAADGLAFAAVPAGVYVVQPQPVDGLMGVAESQNATVVDGATTSIELAYDTGIR